jgi:hypothetical protein
MRLARCEQDFGAAHREREGADYRALYKSASFNIVHGVLPTRGLSWKRDHSPLQRE